MQYEEHDGPAAFARFVAVARSGNVSRAAASLHLSQPAVSLQLKALADQTGLTLFSRKARGLELTRDGAALLPQAERVLASLADFNRTASGLARHGARRACASAPSSTPSSRGSAPS